MDIPKKISISASKTDWIFRRPTPCIRVIVPVAKSNKPRVTVVQASGKAKGDGKSAVGVGKDISESVVIDYFDYVAGTIRHHSERADLVISQVVGYPTLSHGNRHAIIGVFEPLNKVVGTIINSQKGCQTLPQILFCDGSVDSLGDPSAQRIMIIGYHITIWQIYLE